jgi:hypothetical protein
MYLTGPHLAAATAAVGESQDRRRQQKLSSLMHPDRQLASASFQADDLRESGEHGTPDVELNVALIFGSLRGCPR